MGEYSHLSPGDVEGYIRLNDLDSFLSQSIKTDILLRMRLIEDLVYTLSDSLMDTRKSFRDDFDFLFKMIVGEENKKGEDE